MWPAPHPVRIQEPAAAAPATPHTLRRSLLRAAALGAAKAPAPACMCPNATSDCPFSLCISPMPLLLAPRKLTRRTLPPMSLQLAAVSLRVSSVLHNFSAIRHGIYWLMHCFGAAAKAVFEDDSIQNGHEVSSTHTSHKVSRICWAAATPLWPSKTQNSPYVAESSDAGDLHVR